jgi:Rhodanese-like domain
MHRVRAVAGSPDIRRQNLVNWPPGPDVAVCGYHLVWWRASRDWGSIVPTGIGRSELRILTERGAQLVEVLPAAEYDWAHLPGAVNLPLKELDAMTEQLDRSRPVIVYCHDSL